MPASSFMSARIAGHSYSLSRVIAASFVRMVQFPVRLVRTAVAAEIQIRTLPSCALALDYHEPHRWSCDCFSDLLAVARVVLIRLHVRPHEGRSEPAGRFPITTWVHAR